MEQAKEDLKKIIIAENSEEYYYQLIGEKSRKIHQFKLTADSVFGALPDDEFRQMILEEMVGANEKKLSEDEQLYEFILTDIALDVFLKQ